MNYKVSKDYPRLKQLLDSGYWVVCWVTYDWSRGNGHMVTDIALAKHRGVEGYEQYSVACRGTGFGDVFPQWIENYTDEFLYKSWEDMNLQFIDLDHGRNTLELKRCIL
jgi:hypothetical protein